MGGTTRKSLRLLTTAQLARKLGVKPWTVRRMVACEYLQAINVGNVFYFQATLLPQYKGALTKWQAHALETKRTASAIARDAWNAQRAAHKAVDRALKAPRALPETTLTSVEQIVRAVAALRTDLTLVTSRLDYLYRELGLLDTTPDTPVQ